MVVPSAENMFVAVMVCGHHVCGRYWPSWFVAIMVIVYGRHGCGRHVCGRHGLWLSCLWPSWFVAIMVCGHHGHCLWPSCGATENASTENVSTGGWNTQVWKT